MVAAGCADGKCGGGQPNILSINRNTIAPINPRARKVARCHAADLHGSNHPGKTTLRRDRASKKASGTARRKIAKKIPMDNAAKAGRVLAFRSSQLAPPLSFLPNQHRFTSKIALSLWSRPRKQNHIERSLEKARYDLNSVPGYLFSGFGSQQVLNCLCLAPTGGHKPFSQLSKEH